MASIDSQKDRRAKSRPAVLKIMAIAALLGACAEPPSPPPAPVVGREADCAVEPALKLVGQPDTPENRRRVLELSGSEILRVLRPGDGATADYQTARVNLLLDAGDRIAEIRCG